MSTRLRMIINRVFSAINENGYSGSGNGFTNGLGGKFGFDRRLGPIYSKHVHKKDINRSMMSARQAITEVGPTSTKMIRQNETASALTENQPHRSPFNIVLGFEAKPAW
ncbi:hypothetical protein KFU94_34505 [Chloroflexi bacterium TSY]|nr:hypothetical protein [Chloroflexi bacterium TSY]